MMIQRGEKKKTTGQTKSRDENQNGLINEGLYMVPHLDISASASDITRYHSLLTKEWTKRTVEDVLHLLWSAIADSENIQQLPFRDVLDPDSNKNVSRELNEDIIRRIREFASFF